MKSTARKTQKFDTSQQIGSVQLPSSAVVIATPFLNLAVLAVTPEMARSWLDERAHNRDVRISQIGKIARAIEMERWITTHQGIAFRRSDGALFDGQHRLEAIVLSQKTVTLVVAWNVADEAMDVIDIGSARTNVEILTIGGETLAKTRQSICRVLTLLFRGHCDLLSPLELRTLFEWCREPFDAVNTEFATHNHDRGIHSATIVGACTFAWPTNPSKVVEFIKKLCRREPGSSNEPPLVLRETILKTRVGAGSDGQRLQWTLLALSALRAYLQGEQRQLLRPISPTAAREFFQPAWENMCGAWPLATD